MSNYNNTYFNYTNSSVPDNTYTVKFWCIDTSGNINNTDINSINIAEGCAPSGINDAIRELMRQLKEFQTGGAGDSVNSGGDFSVAVIFDRETGEEVAMFRGLLPPDRFADTLDKRGREYNNAYMVVEINNHGLTTVTCLKQKIYPSLYFRPAKFEVSGLPVSNKLGWKTTKVTRPLLIDDFAQACRDRELIIHSKEILDEMSVFVYDDNGNMVPMEGYHDDCIFSCGIAFQGFKVSAKTKMEQLDYASHLPTTFAY